jgi:hypothetical protein
MTTSGKPSRGLVGLNTNFNKNGYDLLILMFIFLFVKVYLAYSYL